MDLLFIPRMEMWISILQSNLTELFAIEEALVTSSKSDDEELLFYTRVMINYFRENPAGIEDLLASHTEVSEPLKILAEMRLIILKSLCLTEITELQIALNGLEVSDTLKGESLAIYVRCLNAKQ